MEKRHDLHSDLKQIEREFLHIGEDEVKEESKSEENVTPTASEIVVGKQRFFPTGGQIQFPSDEDTDVFGAVKSEESVLLQFSDVLTSAAAACLNDVLLEGSAKARFVQELEERLGRPIGATWRSEQKFNVFEIQPEGGW